MMTTVLNCLHMQSCDVTNNFYKIFVHSQFWLACSFQQDSGLCHICVVHMYKPGLIIACTSPCPTGTPKHFLQGICICTSIHLCYKIKILNTKIKPVQMVYRVQQDITDANKQQLQNYTLFSETVFFSCNAPAYSRLSKVQVKYFRIPCDMLLLLYKLSLIVQHMQYLVPTVQVLLQCAIYVDSILVLYSVGTISTIKCIASARYAWKQFSQQL